VKVTSFGDGASVRDLPLRARRTTGSLARRCEPGFNARKRTEKIQDSECRLLLRALLGSAFGSPRVQVRGSLITLWRRPTFESYQEAGG